MRKSNPDCIVMLNDHPKSWLPNNYASYYHVLKFVNWMLFLILRLILCTGETTPKCNRKTDIIFIVDRSGSIRPSDYTQLRKFLIFVGDALQIGVKNEEGEVLGQGAIVTFSEESVIRITLEGSRNPGNFTKVVNEMPGVLWAGRTKTHKALRLADTEVAVAKAGYRGTEEDVAKILVIITDGRQTRESRRRGYIYVGEATRPFFARKDMEVFAIGVGLYRQSARQEIKDMVEQSENAVFLRSYSSLNDDENDFIGRFCPGM